jgi:hypothetical protein
MTLSYIYLAVVLFLILFRKPIASVLKLTRGYRNNNPGNLKLTFDKNGKKIFIYDGEVNGSDKIFRTFKDMPTGYRAMFALLNHRFNVGDRSIRDIIYTWAPPTENETEKYIHAITLATQHNRDDVIDESDDILMKRLAAGISKQENGVSADMNDVIKGYNMFYNT